MWCSLCGIVCGAGAIMVVPHATSKKACSVTKTEIWVGSRQGSGEMSVGKAYGISLLREWRNGMRADRFQLFLYWFGVMPVFSLKYLQKNDVLGKLSVSLI